MEMHHRVTVCLIALVIEVTTGLTCHRAEYLIGQECCPMCPVGTRVNKHCTEFRSTSCLPCDSGTYMDEPTGRTECLRCRMCAAGKHDFISAETKQSKLRKYCTSVWMGRDIIIRQCSSTSDSACEPEDGFFCVGPSDEGNCEATQKHSLCSPGEFIQQPGSSSENTVCSPCPSGTFSNGTLTVCRPHTRCEEKDKVTAKDGTSQSDAECAERSKTPVIISVFVGIMAVVAVVAVVVAVMLKKKKRRPKDNVTVMEKLNGARENNPEILEQDNAATPEL
ncbi:tumor necrosis factor receptor superfamily member 5-like [Boleophthalmus pectinirostris]|uniref:tumor necrosis factor receptor superfamily member 5-like n=1 Tax=Boleophthalmus pectinirostris TaxID=150288 RepID=UPI00242C21A1|nr:tumor necrosis factor receptor superfamily member 5-like [Boleophthalmus pectinirostris]